MSLVVAIPILVASTVGTAVLGLLSKWFDRKLTARLQWRVGPPWYQPFADFLKLLGKETIVPETARPAVFLVWPLVGFAAVSVATTILWVANFRPETGFVGDVIVVLYLLTIPALGIIIGGSASGNPLAAVGASREMKLLLAYELPLLVAILAAIFGSASTKGFRLGGLITSSAGSVPAAIGCVLAFIVAVMCTQAKLGLVPFDMAEAECEIASGPFIEYSGAPLAVIYLTRAMLLAIMPLFLITVFWGGVAFNTVPAGIASVLKYVLILLLLTLIRNTNPRVRIDQAMRFFWFTMTPVAVLAVVLAYL